MPESGSADHKASFSPATENRLSGKEAARGWVLLLLFLPTKKRRSEMADGTEQGKMGASLSILITFKFRYPKYKQPGL